MNTLWLLTKKNLQILIRAKSSALIVIFAPLLLILLLGLSYNTHEQYALRIGVSAPSLTNDVLAFTNLLEEQNFTVIKYEQGVDPCLLDIKSGYVHTCIELPTSLTIEDNNPKEIIFHIDPTRINLVWMIQQSVGSKFSLREQEVSQQLTQSILDRINQSSTSLMQESTQINLLKDKTTSASSSAQHAQQSLKTLDLTFTPPAHDLQVIDNTKAQLVASASAIAQASTEVTKFNLTGAQRIKINTLLTEANTAVNTSIDLIDGSQTSTIRGLIEIFQQDLANATQKMNSASLKVQDSASTLDDTKTSIQETTDSLQTVVGDLDKIQQVLNSGKVTQANTIAAPLRTRIEPISSQGTYLNSLFPSILILVVMFSSLALGTTLVMIEKNSPAFMRNFFLPVHKVTFITSIYFTNLILNIIQIAIILGIALFFLTDSYAAFPAVALILFITGSVFTFVGMIIGYMFNSEETAILASISMGSLSLFVSGILLPIEALSSTVRSIVSLNPFVIAEKLLREIFIFSSPLSSIWFDLVILISYALLLFLVILLIESFFHQHLVDRFMRHHHPKHKEGEKK